MILRNIFILLLLIFLGLLSLFHTKNVSAEVQNEVKNLPLKVTGTIPDWLSGSLIRNGPIKVTVDGKTNEHWFDGLAMLHAFSFEKGHVHYSNRFLRTDAYHKVFEEGSIQYGGFAADPCRTTFKKSLTLHNANVNVAKLAEAYVAMTEVPLPVKFDLNTLETLGVFDYKDALPKEKCWESAHPHYDVREKKTLNYLIEYGKTSYYTLYSIADGSAQRKVIAKVPVARPAYMHSFAITENYMILTEFPLVVNPIDLLLKNRPFIHNFAWQPERGTQFIVISRKDGSVVGTYPAKPFFAFHHANAFEKEGVIYLDIVTYKDAEIITGTSLHVQAEPTYNDESASQLERFSIYLNNGKIESEVLLSYSNEFPTVPDALDGAPYRYVYLAAFHDKAEDKKNLSKGEGLYKLDTDTKELKEWTEPGCSAGEPIFVSSPTPSAEDDGVVMALILDRLHDDSFLLILDGKSFQELGRARAPHLIPSGLHGKYLTKKFNYPLLDFYPSYAALCAL